jgi:hypothetical protein
MQASNANPTECIEHSKEDLGIAATNALVAHLAEYYYSQL